MVEYVLKRLRQNYEYSVPELVRQILQLVDDINTGITAAYDALTVSLGVLDSRITALESDMVAAQAAIATNSADILSLQTTVSGKLGGTLGATDNRIMRVDGAGGLTAQGSSVGLDDSGNITNLGYIDFSGGTDATLAYASAGRLTIEGVSIVKGDVGSTDESIPRADGTGGFTLQSTSWLTAGDAASNGIFITSSTNITRLLNNGNGVLQHTSATTALFDINAVGDSTSAAGIRLFRTTNTSGNVTLQVLRGNNSITVDHTLYGNGGYVCGNPTGGNKGIGSINAVNVYDDNVLLTCMGASKEFIETGTIDLTVWDEKVPPLLEPETEITIPIMFPEYEAIRQVEDVIEVNGKLVSFLFNEKHLIRNEQAYVIEEIYDRSGKKIAEIKTELFDTEVVPEREVKRIHRTARIFKAMLDSGFDPREPEQYYNKWQAEEAIPGMPTKLDWVHGEISSGEMINRLWLSMEMMLILQHSMHLRMNDFEARLQRLEARLN